MSVGYTYLLSVYVLGFENAGFLTQQIRLKSASCTSDQCFAIGFLQTPCYQDALAKSLLLPTYRAEQWTYTTSSAPCRAHLQMADARTSGTATERIYSLVKVMGEDEAFKFQKAMNANVQMYTKSGAGGAMPIATGQCASGIFYIVDALDIQQQGYPVTITYPEDGVSFGIEATGVVKGGKNNAEAKKFVDWVTSKKFAEFIVANKINYVPTRNDVKTSNPILDLTKIKTISVDVTWKGEKRKEFTQRWINEVIK